MKPLSVEPGQVWVLEVPDARKLWVLCLLERLVVSYVPWESACNFSWRVLDLEDGGMLFEIPESHLLAYYSRLA